MELQGKKPKKTLLRVVSCAKLAIQTIIHVVPLSVCGALTQLFIRKPKHPECQYLLLLCYLSGVKHKGRGQELAHQKAPIRSKDGFGKYEGRQRFWTFNCIFRSFTASPTDIAIHATPENLRNRYTFKNRTSWFFWLGLGFFSYNRIFNIFMEDLQ